MSKRKSGQNQSVDNRKRLLYLIEEGVNFLDNFRREGKSIRALRPWPNHQNQIVYLQPQKDRESLEQFSEAIIVNITNCLVFSELDLLRQFYKEASLDLKQVKKIVLTKDIQSTVWFQGDLIIMIIRKVDGSWYARQFEVFDYI